MATYTAKEASHYATTGVKDIECEVLEGIIALSKMHGFLVRGIRAHDEEDEDEIQECVGVLHTDWKSYIDRKPMSKLKALKKELKVCSMGDCAEADVYVCLTKGVLNGLRKATADNVSTYNAQRTLWPKDDFRSRLIKKVEFEASHLLTVALADIAVFKYQESHMNYRLDNFIVAKNNFDGTIPGVGVEIDEDGHDGYNKNEEKARQAVIESFGTRMVRLPVKRDVTQKALENAVKECAKKVRTLMRELVVDYTPEISSNDFIKHVEDHCIDKSFLSKFMDCETGDSVFRYRHDTAAEFLGYDSNKNYQTFKAIFTDHKSDFVEGEDYRLTTEAESCFLLEKEAASEKNLGGAGKNKKTYLLTRSTFNRICIRAHGKPKAQYCADCFAKVYELAMAYVQRLRAKNIGNEQEVRTKHPDVKARIETLVGQKVRKYNGPKMEETIEKLQAEMKEVKEELAQEKDSKKKLQAKYNSIREKHMKLIQETEERAVEHADEIKGWEEDEAEWDSEREKLEKIISDLERDLRVAKKPEPKQPKVREESDGESDGESDPGTHTLGELLAMTKAVLVKMATDRGTRVSGTKKVIAEGILTVDSDSDYESDGEDNPDEESLMAMSIKDLVAFCKSRGIKKYSGKKKDALVEWIVSQL